MRSDLSGSSSDGPIVVLGRPRSGTRVVAELLTRAGVFLGPGTPRALDSTAWALRFVAPLLGTRFFPFDHSVSEVCAAMRSFVVERASGALEEQFSEALGETERWGFKFPEALFVMPWLEELFPRVKLVHVIRDGRDVAVSLRGYFQLTAYPSGAPSGFLPSPIPAELRAPGTTGTRPSFGEFCRTVALGDPCATSFLGADLRDPRDLSPRRFRLQMQSWKHSIERGRASGLRAKPGRYYELRYEELVRDPLRESGKLFDFLGLDPARPAHSWIERSLTGDSVERFRRFRFTPSEHRDFEAAVELGKGALKDLGYA